MSGASTQPDRSPSSDIDDRAHATQAKGMWFVLAVAVLFAAAALTIIYWPKQLSGGSEAPEAPPDLERSSPK